MMFLWSGPCCSTQAPTGPRCIRSAATSITSGPVVKSLLSAPHPRELGQSFDRDSSQRSTMLSAKMLPADPQRQERHGRLPTRECVHRGDIVALHRVRWSQQSPVCGAASGGKHHSRWKVTCNIRVKCPEEGRTPKRKAGSATVDDAVGEDALSGSLAARAT